jgi:anti-anti-sigma regulatory factor
MGKILYAEHDGIHVLKFVGDVRLSLGPTISTFLEQLHDCNQFGSMIVDLSETDAIDSTALGLIAKIAICTKEDFKCATCIVSPRQDITRILTSMAMEQVCVVSSEAITDEATMRELPQEIASEHVMREQVLDAHRTLMSLGEENEVKFRDLVDALENEKSGDAPKTAHTA